MVRGQIRLPRSGFFVLGNLLVPDFCLFDEVGSSGLDGLGLRFGVHLCVRRGDSRLLRLYCLLGAQAVPALQSAQVFSAVEEMLFAAPEAVCAAQASPGQLG